MVPGSQHKPRQHPLSARRSGTSCHQESLPELHGWQHYTLRCCIACCPNPQQQQPGSQQLSQNQAAVTADLESIRSLFNEKEKELSMAVQKVEDLTGNKIFLMLYRPFFVNI